jgi:hypothetical protein
MSQLLSTPANSGYTDYDTLIPSLTETADIVEAFRLYHYGKANFTDGSAPAANSIYSHLEALQTSITAIQAEVEGGIALAPLLFMGG